MRYTHPLEVTHDAFYVGDWLIEPSLNRVTGQGTTTSLEPKVMQVLLCLAQRPGEAVSREALFDEVWADTIVTDHALTRAISELRKIFGDDTRDPHVIETIPKTGYRLVAPVLPLLRGDSDGARPLPGMDEVVPTLSGPPASSPRDRRRAAWVAAGLLVALALAVGAAALRQPPVVTPPQTRPFTTTPGLELSPAFAPDGSRIVYAAAPARGQNADLYIRLADGTATLRLTDTPEAEAEPVWSPDGQQIAFYRRGPETCGLYVVPALGGEARRLLACEPVQQGLAWAPDGTWLAFAAAPAPGRPTALYRLDLATLARRPLTTPTRRSDADPVFSPDGRALSFTRAAAAGVADLFRLDLDDPAAVPVRLTSDAAGLAGHTWTPDGRTLIFSSDRTGLYRLWRVPAAGGTPQPYGAVSAWDPGGPAFAPRGGRLAYVEWFYEVNVWRQPLHAAAGHDTGPQPLITSTRSDFQAVAAPAGRLAFVSNRSGSNEIWVAEPDGSRPVRLTFLDQRTTGRPRWAPAGTAIAFESGTGATGPARDLYVLDSEDAPARRLTDEPADEYAPAWSPDGQWLYFVSDHSGRPQLWKIPAAGGKAVQVTTGGAMAGLPTPDGAALFFVKPDAPGLWRHDLTTGQEEQVYDGPMHANPGQWQVTPQGVYLFREENGAPVVYRLDLESFTPTPLATLPPEASFGAETSLSISPDGSWLYFASLDRFETDLMLVEHATP